MFFIIFLHFFLLNIENFQKLFSFSLFFHNFIWLVEKFESFLSFFYLDFSYFCPRFFLIDSCERFPKFSSFSSFLYNFPGFYSKWSKLVSISPFFFDFSYHPFPQFSLINIVDFLTLASSSQFFWQFFPVYIQNV